jgi:hypothetical protein
MNKLLFVFFFNNFMFDLSLNKRSINLLNHLTDSDLFDLILFGPGRHILCLVDVFNALLNF